MTFRIMNILESIFLGIVQGLTEFLPVSSSGHLVIIKTLFGEVTTGALYESVLHAGTALAVLYYFSKELLNLTKNQIMLIILATVPVAVVGFTLQSFVESLFSSENITFVSISLIATGFINFAIFKLSGTRKKIELKDAAVIGLSQAIALVPGISRSGITILGGKIRGIDAQHAARFSFILSLPAIVGANMLEVYKYGSVSDIQIFPFVVGFIAAFLSGIFAIKVVMNLLAGKKFWVFGVYCIALGFASLLLN